MFRAPDWLNVFLHWAHLCGFSPLWVSICIFRFPASLIELLHCVHLYSFTTYYVKLETLPDSLKNLGASYWVISEKRSVWESYERLRNVYYQKNNAAHLQNRDALRSQPCTFVIGPGSGCHPTQRFRMPKVKIVNLNSFWHFYEKLIWRWRIITLVAFGWLFPGVRF